MSLKSLKWGKKFTNKFEDDFELLERKIKNLQRELKEKDKKLKEYKEIINYKDSELEELKNIAMEQRQDNNQQEYRENLLAKYIEIQNDLNIYKEKHEYISGALSLLIPHIIKKIYGKEYIIKESAMLELSPYQEKDREFIKELHRCWVPVPSIKKLTIK